MSDAEQIYDVAIVGAGVVGTALARQLARYELEVVVLERSDEVCDGICDRLYRALGADALYDDRSDRAGVKFNDADLMGHPWQIIVGPRGAANGMVELKRRATGERIEVSVEDALTRIGPRP